MIHSAVLMKRILFMLLFASCAGAQEPVVIRVDAARILGPWKAVIAYFGYDEPNYTYTKNGRKLTSELAGLSPTPVYIRAHNLLTTGDGTPALKWGSTNAYTEDAQGRPVYDWKIVDQIFDTYVQAGAKPFAEIGFMPEALSVKPQPYQHEWPRTKIEAGWAYPPKDYDKWRELIRQWVRHSVQRYGKAEVESWYWEVWNEPDIGYWQGTPDEYDKLYDYAGDGVRSALPSARVGGPASTGPASTKAAEFLKQFLQHCAGGKNYATGGTGAPLDFISYHAKGSPKVVDGRVRMGLARNLQDVLRGMEIVSSFPQFRKLPIVLSESDPEGCAACSARVYPQNAYRNGELYAAYTAAAMSRIIELAGRTNTSIEGILTWAFEFEDQPYFDGFRTLATNGIDKPVLNFFRAAGLMWGERVAVESSGAIRLDEVLASGAREKPDIGANAAKSAHEITVLVWNYHDDDMGGPEAPISLTILGLSAGIHAVQLTHYRIDHDHSNAYTAWKQMGSPQNPTRGRYSKLEAAGQLEPLGSPRWMKVNGALTVDFSLPRHAVSLLQFAW
jgi:xylan 1,4-beta-xylosidase